MSIVVARNCTEIPDGDAERRGGGSSRPLEEFRSTPAYVLLGDPGSGKSTAFETEYKAHKGRACLVSARDFRTFSPDHHPEWREKTLFIDGLDEVRAGSPDTRTPLDDIRRHLDELGKPHFRLSCREADWLGANDRRHLAAVSPNSEVVTLRLDPLTNSDIVRILKSRPEIDDAEGFIASARANGVDGLLVNPLTLDLLVRVVARGNQWPEGRRETFEAACREMAREHNEEHRLAGQSGLQDALPDVGELLDAAGRLCAVLLISGFRGYALRGNRASDDYPAVEECEYEKPEWLCRTLSTHLFKAEVAEGRFTPIHRHLAEFLAGRYLARLIGDGLPALRVLALITGEDGIVVTEHRSLSAWLAVHCRTARGHLIERDPVGVALYGDIRAFLVGEKRELLASLHREASRLDLAYGTASAFGPLATPATEKEFREVLLDPRRDVAHQQLVAFILCVLEHAAPLPNLANALLGIVRDGSWPPRIKELALDAFLHHRGRGVESGIGAELGNLLADIRSGVIPDPDREMFGTLLMRLFPDEVPPSEIWNYLVEASKSPPLFGRYFRFWRSCLIKGASEVQVAELLDALAPRLELLRPALDSHHLRDVAVELLAQGLEALGDERDTEHLCDWLGVGLLTGPRIRHRVNHVIARIRTWLENRPEVQRTVFAEALQRWDRHDGSSHGRLRIAEYLYGARLTTDFGYWCLEEALAAERRGECRATRYFLERAVEAVIEHRSDEGLSLEVLERLTCGRRVLAKMLSSMLVCPLDEDYFAHRREMRSYEEEATRERRSWIRYMRSSESALRGNRGDAWLLYKLANVYFGHDIDAEGNDPVTRIEHFLVHDQRLTDAALEALRGTTSRDDVPEVEEAIRLNRRNHMPLMALPYLAGLAEMERSAPEELSRLDEDRMRRALVFHYSFRSEGRPEWYRRLLDTQPDLVAGELIRFVSARFRAGVEHIFPLYDLANEDSHAQVARFASLPLLRAFPLRASAPQMEALGCLLWAALEHAPREPFRELLESKLSRQSMNVAQRVRWLAAGAVALPDTYLARLEAFVQEGREHRGRQLADFLVQFDLSSFLVQDTGVPVLKLFIRLMGRFHGPGQTPASKSVHGLIHRLATFVGDETRDALESLASDVTLADWRNVLLEARDHQRIIRRDAVYRHPDIAQVCRTLRNGPPANAGDLAALIVDRLDEIARKIRTANTNDWRPYWNEDQYRKPTEPKHENSCRDALLATLRGYLPEEADAQPEGQYVNDRRSDIRINVACREFHVPVEIKKNTNPTLWSALRKQLIEGYARDPATSGHGIYLVFWFGEEHIPAAPAGARPNSADEFRERLQSTLFENEARKISVVVIDVTPPPSMSS